MKAEGGSLIYIIISIVFLIFSAYQKNKKKVGQPTSEPNEAPETNPQPSWQKELEDIFGPVNEPEVVIAEQPRPVDIIQHQPVKEVKAFVPEKLQEKPTNQLHRQMIAVEEEHELAVIDIDEFELGRAVVYTEILNRKYF